MMPENYTYQLEYHSFNEYEEPVNESIFEFLTLPCSDTFQSLLDYKIICSDKGEVFYSQNSYGFKTIRIRPVKPFVKFKFELMTTVEKKDVIIPEQKIRSSEEEEVLSSPHFYIENFLFLNKTPLTTILPENTKYIINYTSGQGLMNYLTELNSFIHSFLEYKPNETTVDTNANDAINLRKGVCQDFTHLFIAMARKNKIPCRYVSGYLDQGANYVGSAMMHAWAEALIPGIGWVGFDPTNITLANKHYIKVCHGIDYLDCSPIKGILLTNGENKTSHQVKVAQQ